MALHYQLVLISFILGVKTKLLGFGIANPDRLLYSPLFFSYRFDQMKDTGVQSYIVVLLVSL